MPTLKLTDGESSLAIDLVSHDGDAYVSIAIQSHGSAGCNDLYVLSSDFRVFCSSLLSLQRSLQGEARLTAVMPEELDIVVAPADRLGHIQVKGCTGYHVLVAHTSYWHSVHFGFQVEPTQLDAAVKVPWVTEHAV
ncbi:conserved hypothetical protein [uncultured Defluviicoccus sp.]|uniref:Uncharacterized protein n=1 Tax=metagenome TaxID=256318 RepID=A0A380TE46_9ZZZZ|nr:conserved hypothetical protein [uncultured Defluviicoccus sp.]